MRVLFICPGWDNGGLFHANAKALREHLGYDAKQLVVRASYLDYEYDWALGKNVEADEVMDFAKDCDFFVFQDGLMNTDELPFISLLNPHNCCICGTGTALRRNLGEALRLQLRSGIPIVLPNKSGQYFYHRLMVTPLDFIIIDDKRISELGSRVKLNDELTVCHAPTSMKKKGSAMIFAAMDQFPDINFELVIQKSWEDAIRAKARSHVLINSVGGETYGMNCLEGLVMGQRVITDLAPWTYMCHPDIPMTTVNPLVTGRDNLRDGLVEAIRDVVQYADDPAGLFNAEGKPWVVKQSSAAVVCERWKWFFMWMTDKTRVPPRGMKI